MVVEEITRIQGNEQEEGDESAVTTTTTSNSQPSYQSTSPRRQQQQQEQRGSGDRSRLATSSSEPSSQSLTANRETSPPAERPVERKSYSLARRTRSRPAELGSKQPSVEEAGAGAGVVTPTSVGVGGKNWVAGDAPCQGGGAVTGGGGLTGLDQNLARLSLAGQNWTQGPGPASFLQSEMRGEWGPLCLSRFLFVASCSHVTRCHWLILSPCNDLTAFKSIYM